MILVEQPETHLHPRLQARLADLFIDSTSVAGRGNQLIVETHSEHVLLRVQRRIREGSLTSDDVAVIYVDQDESGVATVQRLRLDGDGDFLDEWPSGFFDDRLDELLGTRMIARLAISPQALIDLGAGLSARQAKDNHDHGARCGLTEPWSSPAPMRHELLRRF